MAGDPINIRCADRAAARVTRRGRTHWPPDATHREGHGSFSRIISRAELIERLGERLTDVVYLTEQVAALTEDERAVLHAARAGDLRVLEVCSGGCLAADSVDAVHNGVWNLVSLRVACRSVSTEYRSTLVPIALCEYRPPPCGTLGNPFQPERTGVMLGLMRCAAHSPCVRCRPTPGRPWSSSDSCAELESGV